MATLLKRTGITKYAPNFTDMLFMKIEMASPRGFSDFILDWDNLEDATPHFDRSCLQPKR